MYIWFLCFIHNWVLLYITVKWSMSYTNMVFKCSNTFLLYKLYTHTHTDLIHVHFDKQNSISCSIYHFHHCLSQVWNHWSYNHLLDSESDWQSFQVSFWNLGRQRMAGRNDRLRLPSFILSQLYLSHMNQESACLALVF